MLFRSSVNELEFIFALFGLSNLSNANEFKNNDEVKRMQIIVDRILV